MRICKVAFKATYVAALATDPSTTLETQRDLWENYIASIEQEDEKTEDDICGLICICFYLGHLSSRLDNAERRRYRSWCGALAHQQTNSFPFASKLSEHPRPWMSHWRSSATWRLGMGEDGADWRMLPLWYGYHECGVVVSSESQHSTVVTTGHFLFRLFSWSEWP